MILLTYNKDVVYQITASRDCVIDFQMIGGGGGRGGGDSHPGSSGYAGVTISGSIPVLSGETIYCAIGSGGYGGASGVRASGGGAGGFSVNNYSGGSGGNAGPSGTSGGGGGGGGASLIWKNGVNGYTNSANILAVAPGGPGGGGGGNYSNGYDNASVNALIPPKSYFAIAATNGAYCDFLNNYGVWNGDGRYVYDVYFPSSKNYTFRLSADNFGYLWLDNGTINGNNDYIGSTPGTGVADYNSYYDFTHYVSAGWHTIDVYGSNWGGPASLAAAIVNNDGSYFWTTRNAYNERTYTTSGRGGHGQDHRGDGGGPGGGGGGYIGGTGGTGPYGDHGAMSGNYGITFLSPDITAANNTLLLDAGAAALGRGGNSDYAGGAGNSGGVVFNSIQTDIKYKTGGNFVSVKQIKYGSTSVKEVYVRSSNAWKRVYGDNIPDITSATAAYNNISGAMTPYAPIPESSSGAGDGGGGGNTGGGGGGDSGGCKIICTKLHELGYLPDYIYEADEKFGQYLRDNDPYAYYGYVKWASVVVDWMENDGPQCMFWIRDKKKRAEAQRKMAIAWARRIATPWAHHMAYMMGAEQTDNKAGRMIMKTGMFISRMIGKYTKTTKPTKNVALGYLMWVTFGVFWLLAGVK